MTCDKDSPEGFVSVPNHVGFSAKKIFAENGEIIDGAIAYIAVGGGGPIHNHTHANDHLFIVVKGRARIDLNGEIKIVKENESFLVRGVIPHSVWNDTDSTTIMIGITVHPCTEK